MTTALIVSALIASILAAGVGFVCVLAAAADPEGRAGDIVLWGIVVMGCGGVGFIAAAIWALCRWLA